MKGTQNFTHLILLWVYLCFVYKTVSIYQLIDNNENDIFPEHAKNVYLTQLKAHHIFRSYLMMYKRILMTKKGKLTDYHLSNDKQKRESQGASHTEKQRGKK